MQLNLAAKQTSLLPIFWAVFAPVAPVYRLLLLYGVETEIVSFQWAALHLLQTGW